MSSLTRSSITGLYHPKRSVASIRLSSSLSLTNNQNLLPSTDIKNSAVDRILNADKSGFLPTVSITNSFHSLPTLSSLEQSIFDAQLKRAIASNDTMQASMKRLRTESQNSIEDLMKKNESLERSLHEAKIKISELEYSSDKANQSTISPADLTITISPSEQIKTLQNEKLELKLQLQQMENLHSKEITQLEQTIHDLKHQLIDIENKNKLNEFNQEQLNSINKNNSQQLNEKNQQIEQLQKRVIEYELIISTRNSTNIVNQSLVDDVKRINDIRYENEQLKKEIELLKLKCNERIVHEEEIRLLRQQVNISSDYRTLIAKKDAEILTLREQLAKKNI